jgi:hypothetical protein
MLESARQAAEGSRRREKAAKIVNAMIGQPLQRDRVQSIVFVTSADRKAI